MLWIGLHLPWLSLEAFAATLSSGLEGQPLALVDAHRIVASNTKAQALGVQPGLKRATALALLPDLVLGQADEARDAQALASVAHAALAFTPMVCLHPPDGVLIEVQASLRYFGGHEALLGRLQAAMAPLGHRWQAASAPTALGARWLSQLERVAAPGQPASSQGLHCVDDTTLRRHLDASPLSLLGCAPQHGEALQSMGLRRLGELRRLPRAGLARRFGEALLNELDRAYGHRPDPREPLVLPPTFHSRLELFARADTTEQLLQGAQVLLARLVAWLSAQHAFVHRFTLQMKHEPRWRRDVEQTPPHTQLEIALAEPSRDAAHLLVLLRERLAALQLPAPTLELDLHSSDISRKAAPNDELFPTSKGEREGVVRLIERLQARLGPAQVQRLVPVQDHRPERATCVQPVDARQLGSQRALKVLEAAPAGGLPMRPVWLLALPEALRDGPLGPMFEGRVLRLLAGPERIESGWWDAELVERDYFIAQTHRCALVWLYRTRFPAAEGAGWFLQGLFG
jgi:protein ImuB